MNDIIPRMVRVFVPGRGVFSGLGIIVSTIAVMGKVLYDILLDDRITDAPLFMERKEFILVDEENKTIL